MMTQFQYLNQLKNPHEAVLPSIWLDWVTTIKFKVPYMPELQTVLSKTAKDVATQLGLVWVGNSTDTVQDILSKRWDEIRDRKHVSPKWKKNIVLMISRIIELEKEDLKRISISPPSEQEERDKLKEEFYRDSHIKLVKYILDCTKVLNNDNYEILFSQIVKHIIGFVVYASNYKVEDMNRYLKILYRRYHDMKTIEEISEELNVQPGVINMGSRRFLDTFKTYFIGNYKRHHRLFSKFEEFSDKALEVLDKTDLDIRNARLSKCRQFEKNVLPRPQDYWDYIENRKRKKETEEVQ